VSVVFRSLFVYFLALNPFCSHFLPPHLDIKYRNSNEPFSVMSGIGYKESGTIIAYRDANVGILNL